ncbi:MAG: holdfast anchor protein HfaD [Henriciella sp.]|uniref:holdfast anchor protein HfaD n=1 Tax=Henriciella sp. TaxID=1968823 RepID=UPI003C71BB9E
MISKATRISLLMALSLSTSAFALAQDAAETGTIDQVQMGDVWSDMDVSVPEYTPEVSSTSVAMGNSAAAVRGTGDVNAQISQNFDAAATATNRLRGYSAGSAAATTTSYGNAVTGGTNYGTNYTWAKEQVASGNIAASSDIELLGGATITSATTAMANISSTDTNFGNNYADQYQYSSADVEAETDADMCCDGYAATFVTTAGANATSSTGYTTTNYNRALQTTESGSNVRAVTDVYMNDGTNVTAATTGFGNSATVQNEWGYATLGLEGAPTTQVNGADVDAQTYVTLDHWSGSATASASGVGNSALISNIGSDTVIYADQTNNGTVGAQASLTGESWTGETGVVTSSAIGNAATATVCNYCSDGAVGGQINQTNSGSVYATGSAQTAYGGAIYGSATAVGNSATLQSVGD